MTSKRRLAQIAIVVRDYDEAIEYYTHKLNFTLVEDTRMSETKRWVLVSPGDPASASILLAKAADERQAASIGNQTGGRVFLFVHTDNFERDYKMYTQNGVKFIRGPIEEPYGKVAVFEDLYGNKWDLIEPK